MASVWNKDKFLAPCELFQMLCIKVPFYSHISMIKIKIIHFFLSVLILTFNRVFQYNLYSIASISVRKSRLDLLSFNNFSFKLLFSYHKQLRRNFRKLISTSLMILQSDVERTLNTSIILLSLENFFPECKRSNQLKAYFDSKEFHSHQQWYYTLSSLGTRFLWTQFFEFSCESFPHRLKTWLSQNADYFSVQIC